MQTQSSGKRKRIVTNVTIPASHRDILDKKSYAHIATVDAKGMPQVTPVWIMTDGDTLIINSARGRKKDRNLSDRPEQLAISIQDPDNPYRYIGMQAKVVEVTEEGADDVIHALSMKYGGKRYTLNPKEQRVTYRIEPTSVWTMG
jgi:PPOX class probable F420-dependent enzyme